MSGTFYPVYNSLGRWHVVAGQTDTRPVFDNSTFDNFCPSAYYLTVGTSLWFRIFERDDGSRNLVLWVNDISLTVQVQLKTARMTQLGALKVKGGTKRGISV